MPKFTYSKSFLDVDLSSPHTLYEAYSAIQSITADINVVKSLTTNFSDKGGFVEPPVITNNSHTEKYIDGLKVFHYYPNGIGNNYLNYILDDRIYSYRTIITEFTHTYINPHYVGLYGEYSLTGSYVAKFSQDGNLQSLSSNFTNPTIVTGSGHIAINGVLHHDDKTPGFYNISNIVFVDNDGSKWSLDGSIFSGSHPHIDSFNKFSSTDTNGNSIIFSGGRWDKGNQTYTDFTSMTLITTTGNKFSIDGLKLTQLDVAQIKLNSVSDLLTWILKGNDVVTVSSSDPVSDVIHSYAGNDKIIGSIMNDIISGDEGNDTMIGGDGNDSYYVDSLKDRVIETAKTSSGNDTITSSVTLSTLAKNVENLTLSGINDLNANGNTLANTIIGNIGNNILNGGLGNDTLTGGAGSDIFLFNSKPGINNIDTITDFTDGTDKLAFDDAIVKKLKGDTDLSDNVVTGTVPLDANDYLIYNNMTGTISYDADGSGSKSAPMTVAIIGVELTIKVDDFVIV